MAGGNDGGMEMGVGGEGEGSVVVLVGAEKKWDQLKLELPEGEEAEGGGPTKVAG